MFGSEKSIYQVLFKLSLIDNFLTLINLLRPKYIHIYIFIYLFLIYLYIWEKAPKNFFLEKKDKDMRREKQKKKKRSKPTEA